MTYWSVCFVLTFVIASFNLNTFLEAQVRAAEPNEILREQLGRIELQIRKKSAELEELQKKANEIRDALNEDGDEQKVQLQTILNEIPRDAQPRDTDDEKGMFARDRANKWLESNLNGKYVSFKREINVKVVRSKSLGRYNAEIQLSHDDRESSKSARAAGIEWTVHYVFRYPNLTKVDVDEATAKRLLRLDGKTVTVTGRIARNADPSAPYGFSTVRKEANNRKAARTEKWLTLDLTNITVEGSDEP